MHFHCSAFYSNTVKSTWGHYLSNFAWCLFHYLFFILSRSLSPGAHCAFCVVPGGECIISRSCWWCVHVCSINRVEVPPPSGVYHPRLNFALKHCTAAECQLECRSAVCLSDDQQWREKIASKLALSCSSTFQQLADWLAKGLTKVCVYKSEVKRKRKKKPLECPNRIELTGCFQL